MEKNRILGALRGAVIISCVMCLSACGLSLVPSDDLLSPWEHINLGVAYENSHDYDGALKEYRAAAKEIPIAHLYLGNVFFQRGRFKEAEKSYRKAIDETGDPAAYNNLAWLYYTRNKDIDKAEELAVHAVKLAPDNREFTDTLTKIREKRTIESIKPGLDK